LRIRLGQIHKDDKVEVDWVQTKDMPAVGFTKALPAEKHNQFMKQSGLVDLSSRIDSVHASEEEHPQYRQMSYGAEWDRGEVSQANEAQQIEMLGLVEAGSEAALQEVISKDACRLELADATDIEFVELVSRTNHV
jgi:hypothetical protein